MGEPAPPSASAWRKLLPLLAWVLYVLFLSRALLMELPIEPPQDKHRQEQLFLFSKTVHVLAYAGFAILSGGLRLPRPQRWGLILIMSLHALGTEYGQTFLESRHPSWQDVGFDHIGMMLGIAISWKWWSKAE